LTGRGSAGHGTVPGGDSIRVGHGSVWLTNLTGAKVWRLPVPAS